MKRSDITGIFPDATDEQIKALMNINGADINNARKNADDLAAQLATANAQIEDLTKNVSDLEATRTRAQQFETELNDLKAANAVRDVREKVSKATGVPVNLLTATTEEECNTQALNIKEFARPSVYPHVPDGGEAGGVAKPSTREQFAEWFNQQ